MNSIELNNLETQFAVVNNVKTLLTCKLVKFVFYHSLLSFQCLYNIAKNINTKDS